MLQDLVVFHFFPLLPSNIQKQKIFTVSMENRYEKHRVKDKENETYNFLIMFSWFLFHKKHTKYIGEEISSSFLSKLRNIWKMYQQ